MRVQEILISIVYLLNFTTSHRQRTFQPNFNLTLNFPTNRIKSKEDTRYLKKLKLASYKLTQFEKKLSRCKGIELETLDIMSVQPHFQTQRLTSYELVRCYLRRIQYMDPYLNSIIQLEERLELLKVAKALDREREEVGPRSLLHGVPVLIKDNLVVNSKTNSLRSSSGSLALLHTQNKMESKVVTILREKGAIILGLTNLSEFSGFRTKVATGGWSGRGGQSRSPYILSASASGSSTGSAVAVAMNFALVALGTETDGSITAPASRSAVVGLKPSFDTISTKGLIPLSKSQDTIGPFGKSVVDVALMFHTLTENREAQIDLSLLSLPHQLRVGVVRQPYWESTYVQNQLKDLQSVLNHIQSVGFKVIDPIVGNGTLFNRISKGDEEMCFRYEMKHYLNQYLRKVDHDPDFPKVSSLKDIIQFNLDHPKQELPIYDQQYLLEAQNTTSIEDPNYLQMRSLNWEAATHYLENLFDQNQVDVLVVPAEYYVSAFTPPAIAGYPLPLGLDSDGLPFGLALIGKKFTEPELFRLAYQLTGFPQGGRPRPKFVPCCSFDELPPFYQW